MNDIRYHCLTSRYKGIRRELVNDVEISQAFNPSSSKPPPLRQFKAIWDTGATNTGITQRVVNECGLKPIDLAEVHTAGGIRKSQVYLVSVGLPSKVMITSLPVTDVDLIGDEDVLIGMDIMSQGDFALSNFEGKTTFTFRIPSFEEIDFTQKPSSLTASNTKRKRRPRTKRSSKKTQKKK